jgi:hypothetical protein
MFCGRHEDDEGFGVQFSRNSFFKRPIQPQRCSDSLKRILLNNETIIQDFYEKFSAWLPVIV